MKVLMPFWDMSIIPRYIPQITAIAKHCQEFTVIYTRGEPRKEWLHYLKFHRVDLKNPDNTSLNWYTSRDHVAQQLNDLDYDLVYTLSGRWMQFYATHLSRQRSVPQVIRLRGDPETADGMVTPGWVKGKALDFIYHDSFTHSALVIPIAAKLKPIARRYGATTITEPIPNGVDTEKFHPTEMPPMYHALYVGRVSTEKGRDFLLRLMHATPEITYGVVGPIQCDWHPPGNCETIGPVPYEEVQTVYNHANILLLPSITEGIPNTLLEAYASARPVIGTPDAIPPEIQVYGLRLPLDVEVWAEMLRRLKWFNLADMGRQARDYVQRFSWDAYGHRMHRLLEAAASGEPIQPEQEAEVRV